MAWTIPRTWVAGEKPTAATLNTHIRDNLKAIGDPWTSYTPTWTASVNPALGNGTWDAAYINAGKLAIFRVRLTMGSTTTYGTGQWSISLPVTLRLPARLNCLFMDASTGSIYHGTTYGTSTTVIQPATFGGGAGGVLAAVQSTAPFTWAVSDVLDIWGTGELA